jgi:hypothetical protein
MAGWLAFFLISLWFIVSSTYYIVAINMLGSKNISDKITPIVFLVIGLIMMYTSVINAPFEINMK